MNKSTLIGRLEGFTDSLHRARLRMVLEALPFRVQRGQAARAAWDEMGMSLAQRDRLLETLLHNGVARLVVDESGIRAVLAEEGSAWLR